MEKSHALEELATDLAFALSLLKSSNALYHELLAAVEEHVNEDGSADVEALLARFNAALTTFAPREREIGKLLARFHG